MAETFVVPVKGIGKPDYSKEISSGQVRPGISVGYNQILKMFTRTCNAIFSPFAWFRGQLAIGETDSLMDADTGLEMPFNVGIGYAIECIDRYLSGDGDLDLSIYFDAWLVIAPIYVAGGSPIYITQIQPYSSTTLDPTAAAAHIVDCRVTNRAGVAINCSTTVFAVMALLGTPPLPETKPIKCKHCGNIDVVPYKTTNHICTKCGKLTIVYNMRDIKHF